jgi:hypothetical protein
MIVANAYRPLKIDEEGAVLIRQNPIKGSGQSFKALGVPVGSVHILPTDPIS